MGSFVQVEGNITADVELRYTPSGTALATFSVADNRKIKRADGTEEDVVSFFDVKVWRDLAENVVESVRKGDRIVVSGRLEQERWQDKETEQNRSRVVIVADTVSPSLRWATAAISKREKVSVGGGAAGNQPPEDYYNDEPF